MKLALGLVTGLGLVALLACNGSDDDDGDGAGMPGTPARNADIDDLIQLTCDRIRECCEGAGRDTQGLDDCESRALGGNLVEAVRSGRTQLIDPGYNECLELLREPACDGEMLVVASGQGCAEFFRGTVREGGACNGVFECARGTDPVLCLRAGVPDEEPGVCRTLARADTDEECLISTFPGLYGVTYSTPETELSWTLAYCDSGDGLFCAPLTQRCAPYLAEGEACQDLGCAEGLYCDTTCKPKKPAGSACASSIECASPTVACSGGQCTGLTLGDSELCEGNFD